MEGVQEYSCLASKRVQLNEAAERAKTPKQFSSMDVPKLAKTLENDLQQLRSGQRTCTTVTPTLANMQRRHLRQELVGTNATSSPVATTFSTRNSAKQQLRPTQVETTMGTSNACQTRLRCNFNGAKSLDEWMSSAFRAECRRESNNSLALRTGTTNKKAFEVVASALSAARSIGEHHQCLLPHAHGAPICYGSSIALQAHHGGYLLLDSRGQASASAHHPIPLAVFTIWNVSSLHDTGIVRYGDRVWLQCSRYEVLGSSAQRKDYVSEWNDLMKACSKSASRYSTHEPPDWRSHADMAQEERKIIADTAATLTRNHAAVLANTSLQPRESYGRLCAVHCSGSAFAKAQQIGRWVIVNSNSPHAALGNQVLNFDEVSLQQEWLFVSSRRHNDAELRGSTIDTSRTVEKIQSGSRQMQATLKEDCVPAVGSGIRRNSVSESMEREFTWTLHAINVPAKSENEQKRLQCAMSAARQLDQSNRNRAESRNLIMRLRLEQKVNAENSVRNMLQYLQCRREDCQAGTKRSKEPPPSTGNHVVKNDRYDSHQDDVRTSGKSTKNKTLYHDAGDDEAKLTVKQGAFAKCDVWALSEDCTSLDRVMAQALIREVRASMNARNSAHDRHSCNWLQKVATAHRECLRQRTLECNNPQRSKRRTGTRQSTKLPKRADYCHKERAGVVIGHFADASARLRTSVATAYLLSTSNGKGTTGAGVSCSLHNRPASAPALGRIADRLPFQCPTRRPEAPGASIQNLARSPIAEQRRLSMEEQEHFVAFWRMQIRRRPFSVRKKTIT